MQRGREERDRAGLRGGRGARVVVGRGGGAATGQDGQQGPDRLPAGDHEAAEATEDQAADDRADETGHGDADDRQVARIARDAQRDRRADRMTDQDHPAGIAAMVVPQRDQRLAERRRLAEDAHVVVERRPAIAIAVDRDRGDAVAPGTLDQRMPRHVEIGGGVGAAVDRDDEGVRALDRLLHRRRTASERPEASCQGQCLSPDPCRPAAARSLSASSAALSSQRPDRTTPAIR